VTHSVPVAVVLVYLVALFAVTWWARRLTARGGGGMIGYLLAGRGLPSWVGAALLAGLAVGGVSTVGTAEWAYTRGISAGWYNAAWAAGAFVVAVVAAGRYRRLEVATLPELFERHYSTTARVLGVIGQLVIQVVITSLQYVAGAAILCALFPQLSLRTGMLLTAVVFVAITLIGGFWAAGLTNVVNVVVIYVGVLVCAGLSLGRVGGLEGLSSQLAPSHPGFDLFAMGPGVILAWFLVMVTQAHSTQAVIQVGFACKGPAAARGAYLLGGLLILPVGFVSAVIGMAAAVFHRGVDPATALPTMALDMPPLVAGIALAGLWAADVSTASALLMGSATLVSSDIVKRFFVRDLEPRQDLRLCRITVAVLSLVTFLLAITVEGILKTLLVGLTLTTAYTLVVLATLFAPGLCRRSSATWTLAATMVALAAWLLMPPSWRFLPHPIYFTWLVSLAVFFTVPLFDRRRIT